MKKIAEGTVEVYEKEKKSTWFQWAVGAIFTFFLLAAMGSCDSDAHAAAPVGIAIPAR